MKRQVFPLSLDEKVERIKHLDLEPIKFKIVEGGEEGLGWTIEKADRVELEYKNFLILNLKNRLNGRLPSIVPTKEVDQFWHKHILDTLKYAEDCDFCLGFFLHHFPYLGLRGAEDAQLLVDCFEQTKTYYLEEFGHELLASAGDCDAVQCAPIQSCASEYAKKGILDHPGLVR